MSKKSFLTGIALGAIVGAGLAYIFGTDQGKKLQKDIKKKGKELASNIPQDLDDLRDIKDTVSEKGSDFVDSISDQAKETLEAVKDTVSETADTIKEKFEEPVSFPQKPRYFKKNS